MAKKNKFTFIEGEVCQTIPIKVGKAQLTLKERNKAEDLVWAGPLTVGAVLEISPGILVRRLTNNVGDGSFEFTAYRILRK